MFRKRSHWQRANWRYLPLGDADFSCLPAASDGGAASRQISLPPHYLGVKMKRALLGLPKNYRAVVLLCDVEELTYREASSRLKVPIGTVMSRLHRARKLMRVALEGKSN